jgi:hypothetical protein
VTTALERSSQKGRGATGGGFLQPSDPTSAWPDAAPRAQGSRISRFFRDPAWPIVAMLGGWPLWWALGIADYAVPLLAIPMAYRMYMWRAKRTRAIRVPQGFGLWIIFLIVMLAGIATISLEAPETINTPTSGRIVSWALRALLYLGATVVLLYAGNLTEQELPRRRLVWQLALVGIYSIIGGLAGLAAPHLHFTAPLALVVPASIQAKAVEIAQMLHPSLTQLQTFQGRGRPQAPFTYSNEWGNNLAIMLPWLAVVWLERRSRSRWQRRIASAVLLVAIIPAILSFDRGLWIGLVAITCYVIARTATKSLAKLTLVLCGVVVIAMAILLSPLSGLISQRLTHGSSDSGRAAQAVIAWEAALKSPIIGYGDTRHQQGSTHSIVVGRTANCSDCGQQDIGAHGQVFLLLIANGFVGTFFYLAFFIYGAWRYRRDRSLYGLAGELVILLGFVFMFAYLSVGVTLAFTMIAYAVLWRNDTQREELEPFRTVGSDHDRNGRRVTASGPPV